MVESSELAGISEKLIDWAATRNTATMQRLAELADQYQKRTRQPLTTKIRHRMMARWPPGRPARRRGPMLVLANGILAFAAAGVFESLGDAAGVRLGCTANFTTGE
ncbi:hypothetical protein OHB49_02500 [Streptomyces sp. NBC_01717]|uniref:hypothetical protein n=1 Tax=Streptomyces sp. NBC_01717 TaxID=2975918 RepID=UPI002E33EDF2|nr:hypothetical protein [Streptomyces sp. NBC_01717]